MLHIKHTAAERFLRYVQIDTQSDPTSTTSPTTEKQKNLSRLLVQELHEIGIADAQLDQYGYVYATIEATSAKKGVPVICFCSHVDTSPDCSGANVKPIVHHNYQGQDLVLPDDTTQIIKAKDHPDLLAQLGNDIITASGTTLLGADNKAGVAAIMDAANFLIQNPQIPHGKIRILFTPDEEVGHGVDNIDMQKLGADFGYTIDGESLGSIENETFSADGANIHIKGVATHPGFAKGKMENAIKIAADIIAALPRNAHTPETTQDKEGFVHPLGISGSLEEANIKFIVRDFSDAGLLAYKQLLQETIDKVLQNYPNSTATLTITEQYRNMKVVLDQYPQVAQYAVEAIRRAGITPKLSSIRGGTDGSRLSFMGLPCPNIFAGEHAFHSRHEWVSVQDMQKAATTIIHLATIWHENTNT